MTTFTVLNRAGEARTIEARDGVSIMEAIRDNGFDELLALCGGCCSCATCHVHVDEAHLALIQPMTADENDLLDGSSNRTEGSRLSCQVLCGPHLEGMVVGIPPED